MGVRLRIALGIVAVVLLTMPAPSLAGVSAGHSIGGQVSRDGAPLRGALVTIRALPTPERMAHTKAGHALAMPVVLTTRTDARGRFALNRLTLPSSSIQPRTGVANLQAFVSYGNTAIPWSFSLATRPSQARGVASSIDLSFAISSGSGLAARRGDVASVRETRDGRPQINRHDRLPAINLIRPVGGGIHAQGCGVLIPLDNYKYGLPEAFADAWSWASAKITFHESVGTNHTLGVAFKAQSGVWSQSGTSGMSESAAGSGDFPGLYDNQVNNEINYREYAFYCGGTARAWYPDSTYALLYPMLGWPHSSHPIWSSCVTYGSGVHMAKEQGTNSTYSYGVDVGPISVSAQGGWTTSISETWNFTATSKLCGNTASGWVASPKAEAHQP